MSPEEIAARRREELDHAQARREWATRQAAARRSPPEDDEPVSLWPLLTLAILGLAVAIAVFLVR